MGRKADIVSLFIRTCTIPEPKAAEIYTASGYKHDPFVKNLCYPKQWIEKPNHPAWAEFRSEGCKSG
jgi:hypothetical protein